MRFYPASFRNRGHLAVKGGRLFPDMSSRPYRPGWNVSRETPPVLFHVKQGNIFPYPLPLWEGVCYNTSTAAVFPDYPNGAVFLNDKGLFGYRRSGIGKNYCNRQPEGRCGQDDHGGQPGGGGGAGGKKTLLCDIDPQGNTTSGYGVNKREVTGSYELLIGRAEIGQAIHTTPIKT